MQILVSNLFGTLRSSGGVVFGRAGSPQVSNNSRLLHVWVKKFFLWRWKPSITVPDPCTQENAIPDSRRTFPLSGRCDDPFVLTREHLGRNRTGFQCVEFHIEDQEQRIHMSRLKWFIYLCKVSRKRHIQYLWMSSSSD